MVHLTVAVPRKLQPLNSWGVYFRTVLKWCETCQYGAYLLFLHHQPPRPSMENEPHIYDEFASDSTPEQSELVS